MNEIDKEWLEDGIRNGWKLPPKPGWFKTMWGVRHIRHAWHAVWIGYHSEQLVQVGIGTGEPNPYDLWVLYAILRGWA